MLITVIAVINNCAIAKLLHVNNKYVLEYLFKWVYMYLCLFVYMHMCMCVCMCVYILFE